MDKSLRQYLESIGLRADADAREAWRFYAGLDGDQAVRARALKAGEDPKDPQDPGQGSGGSAPPDDSADAARRAVDAERQRIRAIRELAGDGVPGELVRRAIDEGWDTERAARSFLQTLRDSRGTPVGQTGGAPAGIARDGESQRTAEVLVAGQLLRAGLRVVRPQAPEETRRRQEQIAEQAEAYRDLSLLELCRESVRLMGGREPVGRRETIEMAFGMAADLGSRAAASTGSVANIFTAVVNARLIQSFEEAPDTTQGWTVERDVPDFRENERPRLGQLGTLTKLARGDEAKDTSPSDRMEKYSAARYAGKFTADEQDVINDRLNALLDMPDIMGQAAARLRPDLVYALLLANPTLNQDAKALFHADHSNLVSGAGTALSATSLQTGVSDMAKQTEDEVNLNLAAGFLIVPQDLFFTASILLRSIERRDDTSTADGTLNPLRDLNIQLRADNRVGVAGVTDPDSGTAYAGTATNWFLSSMRPMIEVGFVAGSGRRPMVRSYVLDKGQWGIGWDVKHDIGVGVLDYRGLYKSDGA